MTDKRVALSTSAIDQLLDAASVVGCRLDRSGRLASLSAPMAEMLHRRPEDVVGQDFTKFVCPAHQEAFRQTFSVAASGSSSALKSCIYLEDGAHTPEIEIAMEPLRSEANSEAGVLLFAPNGGAKRTRQQNSREVENLLAALDEHAIVAVTDIHGSITYVNDLFCAISKYSREELLGQNHRILKSGHHESSFYEQLWLTISVGRAWQGELCNRAKDGTLYWVFTTIKPILDSHGFPEAFVSIRADITPLKLAQQREHRLAFYEPLTDLPNRRLLKERMLARCRLDGSNSSGSLMLINYDNFRLINDFYGQKVGDQIIQCGAARLRHIVRAQFPSGELFHVGGDEFAVLIDLAADSAEANSIAAKEAIGRLHQVLTQPYLVQGDTPTESAELSCSISIGAVCCPSPIHDYETLLQAADIALGAAKARGKNQGVLYDAAMREQVEARHRVEQDLTHAVALNQLKLVFQPIVNVDRQVVGAEALLRWRHPELGNIPPSAFIPIAEESRLIVPVGWWVLERACEQLRQWQSTPTTRDWFLSVNVSARQLKDSAFADNVIALTSSHEISPSKLCLEITETALLEDLESRLVEQLWKLRKLGIKLALDDFGTGFSSLSYLKQLPLTKVKIDQGFISDLLSNEKDQAITRSILALAVGLGLNVVAEGVETEEQFQCLSALRCPNYQGYLFGRPMSAEELAEAASKFLEN